MNILSPSILSADFCILGEQIQEVEKAGAQYLHIDVMDGKFVPSISYGMPVIKSIRRASRAIYDVHLMIEEPERYIEEFVNCGADSVTFHLESTKRADEIIEKLHSLGVKVGISIKPGTDVSELTPYLDKVDMILIMTVEPGFGGQSYIEASTERIKTVRKMIESSGHHIDIEVDGGINRENLHTVLGAGANVIVAGSAIFNGNIEENVTFFIEKMR